MFLGSNEIRRLILEEGLVKDYIDLDKQLQPDGFDLTVKDVHRTVGIGYIGRDSKKLPETGPEQLFHKGVFDGIGEITKFWVLEKGSYLIFYNEEVKLPKNLSAITIQRSTVCRCDNFTVVGTWDAGYNGKGLGKLTVDCLDGLILEKDSRIVKMQFVPILGDTFEYNGNYQKENLQ